MILEIYFPVRACSCLFSLSLTHRHTHNDPIAAAEIALLHAINFQKHSYAQTGLY